MKMPLEGLKVLDLGQYITGPCAAVLLAEMGASVTKIEPPGGDPFRGWETSALNATFVAFNRGKDSVVLDLKSERDKDKLLKLVADADVLIENFRPGVAQRLGIDFESLIRHNDRLLYCSISGFGPTGARSSLPAYDGVAMGYSGLSHLFLDDDSPTVRGPALADAITGHSAAFAIVSALHDRERTEGLHLEVTMVGALLHFMHSAVSKSVVEKFDEDSTQRARASQAFAFKGSDDRAFIIHLSSPSKFWRKLCEATGQLELLEDERFNDLTARRVNYDDLRHQLQRVFSTRSRAEWLMTLQDAGVPCAPVNTATEALEDPEIAALGLITVEKDKDHGPLPQIRPPVHFNGYPLPAVQRAPLLNENRSVAGRLQGWLETDA